MKKTVFCKLKLGILRDVGEESRGVRVVINMAAVVCEAVADGEVGDAEHGVVGANLIEHFLRYGYCRRFVLHNHARLHVGGVEHTVAATPHAVERERYLVGQQRLGVALVVNKVMDEVLAHPFLGRDGHETAAQDVENARLSLTHLNICVERGQVYLKHLLNLHDIGHCVHCKNTTNQ